MCELVRPFLELGSILPRVIKLKNRGFDYFHKDDLASSKKELSTLGFPVTYSLAAIAVALQFIASNFDETRSDT